MKNKTISHAEVIQSIQNLDNDLPLLQDKLTYIRFYSTALNKSTENVNVKLRIIKTTSTQNSHLELAPDSMPLMAGNDNSESQDINALRLYWDKSFNFKLPQGFFTEKKIAIKSKDNPDQFVELDFVLVDAINDDILFKLESVKFYYLELNLRAVAYRYEDTETGEIHQPTPGELTVIRDYIESAFPISKLNWSTLTIDAPREFIKLHHVLERSERTDEHIDKIYTLLFQHLLAIRTQDISLEPTGNQDTAGSSESVSSDLWEPHTLYLGVIKDPSNRLVGSAMDSPEFATPHVVACCGALPYGEVGAHELAHMLGRPHPGIPDRDVHGKHVGQKNQIRSAASDQHDSSFPECKHMSPLGHLSDTQDDKKRLIGLDTQFKSNQPHVLPCNEYFDLMTYRFPKWVSGCTYRELKERITKIQPSVSKGKEGYYWNVIGEYSLLNKTAKINYVLRSRFSIPKPGAPDSMRHENDPVASLFKLEIQFEPDENGGRSDSEWVYLRRTLQHSDNSRFVGVFQHTLKTSSPQPPSQVQLLINGNQVDVYSLGDNAKDRDQVPPLPSSRTSKYSLKYSVDKAGFYLSYDWPAHHLPESNDNSDMSDADNTDERAIDNQMYRFPIITTVQFKSNQKTDPDNNNNDEYENRISKRWQTVAVTNRLRETLWISPELTHSLASPYELSGTVFSPISTKPDIRDFKNSFRALDVRFRICITVQGDTKVVYDSSAKDVKENNVKIESFGSKGPDALNYYLPCHAGNDSTDIEKYYYRPNVLDTET